MNYNITYLKTHQKCQDKIQNCPLNIPVYGWSTKIGECKGVGERISYLLGQIVERFEINQLLFADNDDI